MDRVSVSRRDFLTRSSGLGAVLATAPSLAASAWTSQQHAPDNRGHAALNQEHHNIVVPLYRAGKFVEVVSGDPHEAGQPYVIRSPILTARLCFLTAIPKM
jgi:hypothetical protein